MSQVKIAVIKYANSQLQCKCHEDVYPSHSLKKSNQKETKQVELSNSNKVSAKETLSINVGNCFAYLGVCQLALQLTKKYC